MVGLRGLTTPLPPHRCCSRVALLQRGPRLPTTRISHVPRAHPPLFEDSEEATAVSTAVAPTPAEEAGDADVSLSWGALPARWQLVLATSLSFVVCNMDKVNMSVAILPMSEHFHWSPSVSGLVQSSFFWGYMLSQIPGGFLINRLGGRRVLPAGVALWSLATAGVPVLGSAVPTLCLSRAMVGLGESIAPSSATDMVARMVPKTER